MNRNLFYLGLLVIGLASCNQKPQEQEAVVPDQTESVENVSILRKVDDLHQQLKLTIADFDRIATLDHHRMAQKEGVYTPPAIASIFSDSSFNSTVLSLQLHRIPCTLSWRSVRRTLSACILLGSFWNDLGKKAYPTFHPWYCRLGAVAERSNQCQRQALRTRFP